jgi:hypothetical protein
VGKVLGGREVPGNWEEGGARQGRKGRCQAVECQTRRRRGCRWRKDRKVLGSG